jgi:hypothetical protein
VDKLKVTGISKLVDGEYEFDLAEMMSLGEPGSLTNREGHRLKVMSGVRMGELEEALLAGDNDVLVALAAIVLERRGKRVDENMLWDAPMGSGLEIEIGDREDTPAEGEEIPLDEGAETPA